MPQMSPMDWLMLFLYFFMIYFMVLMVIYFMIFYIKKDYLLNYNLNDTFKIYW